MPQDWLKVAALMIPITLATGAQGAEFWLSCEHYIALEEGTAEPLQDATEDTKLALVYMQGLTVGATNAVRDEKRQLLLALSVATLVKSACEKSPERNAVDVFGEAITDASSLIAN